MTPESFTEELKTLYRDNLKSVVLFGSAASEEYSDKYSDFNVMVVLDRIGLEELKRASDPVRQWVKQGNPPPLFFTLDRLQRSEDVFPIEFLDMRDRHRVLYGDDPFRSLVIHDANLRLELEHELKGKLIKLRESYILTGGKPGPVRELMARAGSTFEVLFLGVLRLHGTSPLPPKAEAARRLSEFLKFDAGVFDYIEGLRRQERGALKEDPEPRFDKLLQAVETVADNVDRWEDKKRR